MLIIMVRANVEPTTLYHSTEKSLNWPLKIGKKLGRFSSLILELTSNMIIPYKVVKVRATESKEERELTVLIS